MAFPACIVLCVLGAYDRTIAPRLLPGWRHAIVSVYHVDLPLHAALTHSALPTSYVQAENADLTKRLTGAHESLAQAQLDLGEAQGNLQQTRDAAAALEQRWDWGMRSRTVVSWYTQDLWHSCGTGFASGGQFGPRSCPHGSIDP
jgi:hypothetical protein